MSTATAARSRKREPHPRQLDSLVADLPVSMAGQPAGDLLAGDCEDWRERALCQQTDPEAFFPERGGSASKAKAVCGRCDVRAECLAYALDTGEKFGIWGGLSEQERRKLKSRAG